MHQLKKFEASISTLHRGKAYISQKAPYIKSNITIPNRTPLNKFTFQSYGVNSTIESGYEPHKRGFVSVVCTHSHVSVTVKFIIASDCEAKFINNL